MSVETVMPMSAAETQKRIEELGAWFQNLNLNGVQTAPNHFLGDYPAVKFASFANAIPQDLSGKSVLDIGCNAGFYSLEMKRRGAERVLGIDFDERYLAQARCSGSCISSGAHVSRAMSISARWSMNGSPAAAALQVCAPGSRMSTSGRCMGIARRSCC